MVTVQCSVCSRWNASLRLSSSITSLMNTAKFNHLRPLCLMRSLASVTTFILTVRPLSNILPIWNFFTLPTIYWHLVSQLSTSSSLSPIRLSSVPSYCDFMASLSPFIDSYAGCPIIRTLRSTNIEVQPHPCCKIDF